MDAVSFLDVPAPTPLLAGHAASMEDQPLPFYESSAREVRPRMVLHHTHITLPEASFAVVDHSDDMAGVTQSRRRRSAKAMHKVRETGDLIPAVMLAPLPLEP